MLGPGLYQCTNCFAVGHAAAAARSVCAVDLHRGSVTVGYRVTAEGFLYLADGVANLGLLLAVCAPEWLSPQGLRTPALSEGAA